MKMNGIGSILNPGLQLFFDNSKKLENIEMSCNLKASSHHRKSVLPHINDKILMEYKYSFLLYVKISGAVGVTDKGCCSMIKKCVNIHTLDISDCNRISNVTMFMISKVLKKLKHLDVSYCTLINDHGVREVCSGCNLLVELHLNGIGRLGEYFVCMYICVLYVYCYYDINIICIIVIIIAYWCSVIYLYEHYKISMIVCITYFL